MLAPGGVGMLGIWAPMQGMRPYFNIQKAYRWLTFGDNSLSLRGCVSDQRWAGDEYSTEPFNSSRRITILTG